MKRSLIILIGFLSFGLSSGQDRAAIDSLKDQYLVATDDSVQVHFLNMLIGEFYNYSTDSILLYTRKLEQIALENSNLDYLALANHHLGTTLLNQSHYQQAVDIYKSNIEHYTASKKQDRAMSAHFNLAVAYSELGNLEESAKHYYEVLEYYEQTGDVVAAANVYNGLGIAYETFQEYDQAILFYHKGLTLLGPAYSNKIDKANIYSNLAELYLNSGLLDSAKYYIQEAIRINEILNLKWGLGYSHAILSAIALTEKQPSLAFEHAQKSMACRQTDGSPTEIAESHLALAKAYHELERFSEAQSHYLDALQLSDVNGYLVGTEASAEGLAKLFEQSGDYDRSLHYYKLQRVVKDSLRDQDKLMSLRNLEFKYAAVKKEKEITEQELRIEKQNQLRTYLILGLISVSLVSLFIYYRYRKNKLLTQKELQLQREKIASLRKENQLKAVSQVVEEQVQTQRQIATHLLDSLGAVLASSRMKLQRLQTEQNSDDPDELVLETDELIKDASSEIRRIAQEMMPEALIHLGLPAALNDLCHEIQKSGQVTIHEVEHIDPDMLSEQQEVMIYNIMKDILQHILNTTNTPTITLTSITNERVHLFEVKETSSTQAGISPREEEPLLRAKSQIKYLAGELKISASDNGGRLYTVSIPI